MKMRVVVHPDLGRGASHKRAQIKPEERNIMNRFTSFACAAVIAVFAVAPSVASAEDPYKDRPQIVVQIADLDLDRPVDQAELAKRVDRAARNICRDLPTRTENTACLRETIDYSMTLAPAHVRHAYSMASERIESFTLAQK
jgi:UrcA family protein